jgi:hypothetical protein
MELPALFLEQNTINVFLWHNIYDHGIITTFPFS